MKPSHTPATTAVLRKRRASPCAAATTSAWVAAPRTISSKGITGAGLKKCSPTTSCGRRVLCAIRSTSSVDVLVPRMAPGLRTRSSSRKTAHFTAMSSNTASMARSACAMPAISPVVATAATRCSACLDVSRLRAARRSKCWHTCARPCASRSASTSCQITGRPASARQMTMPVPIVPAPTTATCSMRRADTSPAGGRGRSAKKA
ncbi:hypothetical protein DK45_4624 [Bordetella bronchiseptica]|nr:hypothetical protein DK45_4624 [Bordetella bronchiseptica]